MSTCPDCGAENVSPPEGAEAHCGRRISWASIANDSEKHWKERVSSAEACKAAARRLAELAGVEPVQMPKSETK